MNGFCNYLLYPDISFSCGYCWIITVVDASYWIVSVLCECIAAPLWWLKLFVLDMLILQTWLTLVKLTTVFNEHLGESIVTVVVWIQKAECAEPGVCSIVETLGLRNSQISSFCFWRFVTQYYFILNILYLLTVWYSNDYIDVTRLCKNLHKFNVSSCFVIVWAELSMLCFWGLR